MRTNGGQAVSYKSEIQANTERMNRKKKVAFLALKITSALLSVMMIVSTALVIVDILNGDLGKRTEQTEDAPSLIRATQGKSIKVFAGDTLSYKSLVEYPAGYELDYDSNADLSKVGKYTVTYKLLKEGKVVETYKITIIVEERDVDREELMALVEKKAAALGITKEMSKVEQVRKIYAFVNDPTKGKNEANIYFNDMSNTAHLDPNRENWETMWVKEALLTLQSMKGDCYSYYAVSKAFFEYFEIENVGIQRGVKADIDISGTHFWSVVNVGTKEKPKWYYYDSTRLAQPFSDGTRNACLITLDKLQSYVTTTGQVDFYYFDPTQYPTAETKPLS